MQFSIFCFYIQIYSEKYKYHCSPFRFVNFYSFSLITMKENYIQNTTILYPESIYKESELASSCFIRLHLRATQ